MPTLMIAEEGLFFADMDCLPPRQPAMPSHHQRMEWSCPSRLIDSPA